MYSGTANSLSNLKSGNIDTYYTTKSTKKSNISSTTSTDDTDNTTSVFLDSITTDHTVSKDTSTYLSDSKKYAKNLISDIDSLDADSSADKMVSSVNSFVNNYNKLLSTSKNYSDDGSSRLTKQLSGTASVYKKSLSKIGISVGTDGTLSVNKDKLQSAADDGSLSQFIKDNKSSTSYGLFNKVSNISNNIDTNSTYYLSSTQKNNLAYSNNISNTVMTNYNYSKLAYSYEVIGTMINNWF